MGIEAERKLELHTPLGPDKLLIRQFHGFDQLSACFEYVLSLYSTDQNIDPNDLLGHNVSVRVRCGGQPERFIDGICCEFGHVGTRGRYATYHMVLRPWLWLLSTRTDCRVFQELSSVEIVREVVDLWSDAKFEIDLRVKTAPPPREFCVQYAESDLSFVMRLLEDDGLYFFFEYEKFKHKLVIADEKSAHKPAPGAETLSMRTWDSERKDGSSIWGWNSKSSVTPGGIALRDYSYLKPRADIDVDLIRPKTKHRRDNTSVIYEYPGHYREVDEGNTRRSIRLEELQANFETAEATTDASGVSAGTLFTLKDHKREAENREYLVTSVVYQADSGAFESGDGPGADFQVELRCIPTSQRFRPERKTAWPVVPGAQTATVVGHKEGEVTTHDYASVKVHFHWNRARRADKAADPPDKHCSVWVRVAQSWTGSGWGALFIPRVGQEVVVDFLEGNPDRPLITGCVYNNRNPPPFDKPSESGWKTRTLDQGGVDEYNELRFDDAKGKEQVVVQAQRDMKTTVKHDKTTRVRNNETHTVTGKRQVTVEKGDHLIDVNEGQMTVTVKKATHLTQAPEIAETGYKKIIMNVPPAGEIVMTADSIKLSLLTSSIELTAQGIEIKAGASSISLGLAGIDIKGLPFIKLNS